MLLLVEMTRSRRRAGSSRLTQSSWRPELLQEGREKESACVRARRGARAEGDGPFDFLWAVESLRGMAGGVLRLGLGR